MNNEHDLFERAKSRRALAALALKRQAGTKREMTPKDLKEALNKVTQVKSLFGAPKDAEGKPVGKAGRTLVLIEAWLQDKGKMGLPSVGAAFEDFIKVSLDKANYVWGQGEAVEDTARDIHYNYGFDPREVELTEEVTPKTEPVEQANMVTMPKIAHLKNFCRVAEAYEPAKTKDHTVIEPVVPVTRVDYTEDIEKAKEKSQLPTQSLWNKRNVGINDLLKDLSSADYDKHVPDEDVLPAFEKDKRYPSEKKAVLKSIVKKN